MTETTVDEAAQQQAQDAACLRELLAFARGQARALSSRGFDDPIPDLDAAEAALARLIAS